MKAQSNICQTKQR